MSSNKEFLIKSQVLKFRTVWLGLVNIEDSDARSGVFDEL